MDSKIRSLYSRLKEEVSVDNLKEISSDIIQAYKTRNYPLLRSYASCLGLDIERFGMGVVGAEYFSNQEDTDTESTAERDFYEAVKRELSGGLAYTLSPFDLNSLEGELDLSYYGISNIEGIGHCANITSLNLSGNRIIDLRPLSDLANLESLFISENQISDIESLGSLTGLRELDISFNDIEKADVLLGLENLKYVNVVGNRIEDVELVQYLRKRNTIVIY